MKACFMGLGYIGLPTAICEKSDRLFFFLVYNL